MILDVIQDLLNLYMVTLQMVPGRRHRPVFHHTVTLALVTVEMHGQTIDYHAISVRPGALVPCPMFRAKIIFQLRLGVPPDCTTILLSGRLALGYQEASPLLIYILKSMKIVETVTAAHEFGPILRAGDVLVADGELEGEYGVDNAIHVGLICVPSILDCEADGLVGQVLATVSFSLVCTMKRTHSILGHLLGLKRGSKSWVVDEYVG
jgi:hypothetical protein